MPRKCFTEKFRACEKRKIKIRQIGAFVGVFRPDGESCDRDQVLIMTIDHSVNVIQCRADGTGGEGQ